MFFGFSVCLCIFGSLFHVYSFSFVFSFLFLFLLFLRCRLGESKFTILRFTLVLLTHLCDLRFYDLLRTHLTNFIDLQLQTFTTLLTLSTSRLEIYDFTIYDVFTYAFVRLTILRILFRTCRLLRLC